MHPQPVIDIYGGSPLLTGLVIEDVTSKCCLSASVSMLLNAAQQIQPRSFANQITHIPGYDGESADILIVLQIPPVDDGIAVRDSADGALISNSVIRRIGRHGVYFYASDRHCRLTTCGIFETLYVIYQSETCNFHGQRQQSHEMGDLNKAMIVSLWVFITHAHWRLDERSWTDQHFAF